MYEYNDNFDENELNFPEVIKFLNSSSNVEKPDISETSYDESDNNEEISTSEAENTSEDGNYFIYENTSENTEDENDNSDMIHLSEIYKRDKHIEILNSQIEMLTLEKKELQFEYSKLVSQLAIIEKERENFLSLLGKSNQKIEHIVRNYDSKIEELKSQVFTSDQLIIELKQQNISKDEEIKNLKEINEKITSDFFTVFQRIQSIETQYEKICTSFNVAPVQKRKTATLKSLSFQSPSSFPPSLKLSSNNSAQPSSLPQIRSVSPIWQRAKLTDKKSKIIMSHGRSPLRDEQISPDSSPRLRTHFNEPNNNNENNNNNNNNDNNFNFNIENNNRKEESRIVSFGPKSISDLQENPDNFVFTRARRQTEYKSPQANVTICGNCNESLTMRRRVRYFLVF